METDIGLITYATMGCIVVERVDVEVFVDTRMELANDFEEGTCMYGEFFNLENELMQQDELVINAEVQKMRDELKQGLAKNNVTGPVRGLDLDEATSGLKAEIEDMLQNKVDEIEDKIAKVRQESDKPSFFDEIKNDCEGGGESLEEWNGSEEAPM
jgi:hypothetical protein